MMDATLETLLLSGAVTCLMGWRKRQFVDRTIELHTDGVLYCYEEPRNSMAKNLQERLCLTGARVVDCGTHCGSLCFALELASPSSVEQLQPSGIFSSLKSSSVRDSNNNTGPSNRRCVALFFTGDKLLKWRFIRHLRCAAASLQRKNDALLQDGNLSGDISGKYRLLYRPPRVMDETGDGPLELHEVEQLEDVLREYERLKQSKKKTDKQLMKSEEKVKNGEYQSHNNHYQYQQENQVNGSKQKNGSEALTNSSNGRCEGKEEEEEEVMNDIPIRLTQSPLFTSCIASNQSNQFCADCGAKWPTWGLLQPFGGFVCIHCVGVHRQLWPHRCREAQLDSWNTVDIAFMANRGNATLNDELEYGGYVSSNGEPVYKPVGSRSQHEVRERYIRLKYNRAFTRECNVAVSQATLPPRDPLAQDVAISPHEEIIDNEEGPPRYIGVAYITVREVEGISSNGAVVALTNGFQEVRSQAGITSSSNSSTQWDESFQLGVHCRTDPLYVAVYSSDDKLLGVAEWTIPDGDAVCSGEQKHQQHHQEQQLITVPLLWCTKGADSGLSVGKFFGGDRRQRGSEGPRPLLYLTVSFGLFG
ncbi:GTP-ase activating protein [Trypanosoma theileri]|uniref:GTP-ase activating protein n=1 Tax=Trypanosoma theileri TaxID=67003 RepID=A0A1X0NIZ1_9TRYP|nr:GTP-ase activating protein [Trypanosoma theileri]ORC84705.1 GTP-ase activating protein [Trypanosoma theileri]